MKLGYLEGLRGLAALIVVNEHIMKLLFGLAFADTAMRDPAFGIQAELTFPPFNMLHNGALAVSLFFVLSGYVLSYRFFHSDNVFVSTVFARALGRYIRLALPVTASLVLVYVLLHIDGIFFAETTALTGSPEKNPYVSDLTLLGLMQQGFGTALFRDNAAYNPPLWTMSVEMIGSLGVFLVLTLFGTFRLHKGAGLMRAVLYGGLIAVFFPTLYIGFILGMILCDMMANRHTHHFLAHYSRYWVPVALLLGVTLSAYMIRGLYTNPYRWITFVEFNPYHEYLYNSWGAFFLIAGVAYCAPIVRCLEKPFCQWLGKMSFPLYLTHYTVMSSLTAGLYWILPYDSHMMKAGVSILISLPVMFAVAALFDKSINQPSIALARYLRRRGGYRSLGHASVLTK